MADKNFTVADGAVKRLRDMGDGTYAEVVSVGGVDGDVVLSGSVIVDTLGALGDAKVVNPDAPSATLPSLARGQLKQLVDILAKLPADPAVEGGGNLEAIAASLAAIATAIGAAGDSAGDPTVIGQLKQIAANTTPA